MDVHDVVRDHYRREGLEAVVLDALRRAGVDVDALHVDDLAGLDQFHAGGVAATDHVLDALELAPDTPLLDIGCGLGGPARRAAHRHGCSVTGVDLSEDFVEVARRLTDRVGLTGQVSFEVGSAAELPHDDGAFARAMLNHVGMNIPDKAAVFAETRRVLRPGGLFAVYEQMRIADGALTFPMPWADSEQSSFVEHRERYAELLHEAGFRVERDDDRLAAVVALGSPPAGALGPGDVFGAGFQERLDNNVAGTMAGLLRPVLMVARAR